MYSVVLATMLAAGSTTPAWHIGHRSHCHTCYSGYSCHHSCSGYAFHHHSRHCHSSCYSGYSCYTGCSCYSGCSYYSGCSCYASYGCSCSWSCSTVVSYGCTGCYGGGIAPASPQIVPVPSSEVESLRRELQDLRDKLKKVEKVGSPRPESVSTPTIARVTVTLPSDARLWVDNVECPLTSAVRSFSTPALDANQRYYYNVTMQVVRSGQTLRETQRVLVVPGQDVNVAFSGENASATAAR